MSHYLVKCKQHFNIKEKKMKTAAKVFIIIGMIVGFWYVLPLIFGGIALKKMKTNSLTTGNKICVLLFCNLIAGILLLCDKG